MIVITHRRMDGRGNGYEHIEAVKYYVTHIDPASLPPNTGVQIESGETPVAGIILAIKDGSHVYSEGTPMAEVEIFRIGTNEYIRTRSDATAKNNLLSLPLF